MASNLASLQPTSGPHSMYLEPRSARPEHKALQKQSIHTTGRFGQHLARLKGYASPINKFRARKEFWRDCQSCEKIQEFIAVCLEHAANNFIERSPERREQSPKRARWGFCFSKKKKSGNPCRDILPCSSHLI